MTGFDARCELVLGEAGYPASVAELERPPGRLYVRGDPTALAAPSLAIVGARRGTPYGRAVAEMAAQVAAECGVAVVSGGAIGCDQAAGWRALRAGGRHIMVLGCGADVVYPRSAGPLIERALAAGGAVVSLSPWGIEPRPYAFPKRNRVIAALARAVCVTEAGMPSGTFSTAETAMALGRELLAVPGSILSPQSRGSNYLISVGACCIADEEALEMAISRIYGMLRLRSGPGGGASSPGADDTARRLVDALRASPMGLDAIGALTGEGVQARLMRVAALESSGVIERLVDGRYALTKRTLHALAGLVHNEGS